MEIEREQIIEATFCRVMEQLAFMFAEPSGKDELPAPAGDALSVGMAFSGTLSGRLALAVPAAMCVDLAGNMLGMELDDEDAARKGLDAMKEVLNVTCGNILTELAGTEPVFTLGIPETAPLTEGAWEEFRREPLTLGYLVDDNPVLLQWQVERPLA